MSAAAAPPVPPPRTVVHLITTLTQGGAERVLSDVVPRPDERGEDGAEERHVVVSLAPGGSFADVLVAAGVEVRDLGMRPGRDLIRGMRALRGVERELRPDLIVGWMYHACLLTLLTAPLRRRATQLVWFLQGSLHTLAGLPWHTRLAIRILARASRVPDGIAINSRIGLSHHADLGYRPRRWVLLPNGCDTDTFHPDDIDRAAVRAELGIPEGTVVVTAVARAHPQKDHATLIAAAGAAASEGLDIALLLIGTGTERFATPVGTTPPVIALGGREDVPRLLRAADVFALSSLTEGVPNALLEAMASGLPPVVTDVGDCGAVVATTGRVVPASDPDALGAAIAALGRLSGAERAALGARARSRIIATHGLARARREYRALWDPAAATSVRSERPVRVTHVIARMNVGGPARIIAGLLDGTDPTQVEQTLITGEVGPGEEDWFRLQGGEDARVHRIPSFGRALDPIRDLRTLRRLTHELRRIAPDVVQTHTAKAGLVGRIAAWRAGVPRTIHTFHGHTLHGYFPRPVTSVFTALERRLARRTDLLLAVGARVRDELLAVGIGRPDQYRVIPPGVTEPRTLDRSSARAALELPDAADVVAFIGRLTAVKRPDRFVAAAHLVAAARPSTIFVIAGDGELRHELEAAIARGPADVRLLGWRRDVDGILSAADVIALTSDNEGMPLTLIEAAMAGRACVTTDVGSAAEVVLDGRTGRVVPTDIAELAAAIGALLDDPELRADLERAALQHARATFGLTALVDRMTSLHRRVPTLDR